MKSQLTGVKTKFYSDVKIKVNAGMQFNTKNYGIRVIGYDVFRHYFDNINKDCQIGSQRTKRVIK
jgi:hypothetical protein